jgi:hypothetical protein
MLQQDMELMRAGRACPTRERTTARRAGRACHGALKQKLTSWCVFSIAIAVWAFLPERAFAQGNASIWPIQVFGTVQVEPGANVLTMKIKDEEIRFAVSDVRGGDRRISVARFLSDTKSHSPGLYIRGDESWLDLLLKEKPGKRALRLSGLFYVETRVFVLSNVSPFKEMPKPPF